MMSDYMSPRHVPKPEEVDEAVEKLDKTVKSITVEIKFGKHWRAVRATNIKEFPNQIKPELTILFFKPELVIPTISVPSLDCWVAITLEGTQKGRCSVINIDDMEQTPRWTGGSGVKHKFRYPNQESRLFFEQRFARAMGKRYRHKKLLTDKYEYTKNP